MNQLQVAKRKPAQLARTPFRNMFSRSLFDDWFSQYFNQSDQEFSQLSHVFMDVSETDQVFEVKMDLPGVNPDDVEIQLDNNTLTIRGQRQEETEEKDEERHYHRVERYSGSFSRSVVLPTAISEDEAAAEFRDGVLKIVIPKTEDAKPRKISINS